MILDEPRIGSVVKKIHIEARFHPRYKLGYSMYIWGYSTYLLNGLHPHLVGVVSRVDGGLMLVEWDFSYGTLA